MNDASPEMMSLFFQALQRSSADERAAYLDAACGEDGQLRARIEALLRAHEEAGGFLRDKSEAHDPRTAVVEPSAERPGTEIGPYKLLEQIGEGGMGTVYLAQQSEPVKRLVALKVIKAGMDSRQVIARFEAERQALALMDHPHIAKVLDGGTTASGRPFFVMELVKGVPLTKYCDEQRLTPRQRLELFVPVCQAIQHAHQKGIIHRDVKPSNVLAAVYDGRPVPKVIDFGVAKATVQPLTDKTLVTGFGAVLGTLEYMSPEQAELNQLDIDTRSDVYSLGVLLYELLTGTTPLERKRLKDRGLLEALRLIREEEPPRPSTRLSTTEQLPSIAVNRGVEPSKLSGLMRGELDWIVMKALEKDRNRRYPTANGFVADVQRYLADEPVLACPPSAAYRFRKFVRRNRGRLVFAAGVCVLVAAVLGSISWAVRDRAVREEEKQREQAARQARSANELALALDRAELFQGQGQRAEALAALERAELLAAEVPADPAWGARLAAVKERLAAEARDQEFVARFEDVRLRTQSRVNVTESRFTREAAYPEIGEALRRYGIAIAVTPPAQAAAYIQGRPESVRREVVAALDECLRWAPKGEERTRSWLLATLEAADNDAWRVRVRKALADGNWQALKRMAREADVRKQPPSLLVEAVRDLPGQRKATRLELLRDIQRAYPADLWANHALAFELVTNGQPAEAVRYYTAALALRPDSPGIYLNRGSALQEAGEVDAAIADGRQAVALAPEYAVAHNNLGIALYDKGRLEEAIAEYRESIRIKKDYAEAHSHLGLALTQKGQLDEAIAECREAIRINKHLPGAHNNLGMALHDKGRLDVAIAEFREAIRLEKDPVSHYNLGIALRDKGRLDEAITAYREAIRLREDYHAAHHNLGIALYDKGQLDEAIAEYREAIRLKKDYPGSHNSLGIALVDKGQLDEAIAEYREAIRIQQDDPWAHNNLGHALQNKGQLDEAITEYREAIRLWKDFAEAHSGLGDALRVKGQLEEAIAECREAIRLKKDNAVHHYSLGNALRESGRPEEAIAEFREAIRLKKDFAEAHCNLGNVLRRQGQFRQALEALRRGDELGRAQGPRWRYPSSQWVRNCERLVELDDKLPAILSGQKQPADNAERLGLAQLCQLPCKKRYAAAVRFSSEAFDQEPKLADDLNAQHRYNAACAAALAGCGQGKDADKLDTKERARLRQQALDWLRVDLKSYQQLMDKSAGKAGPVIAQQMQHWLGDTDFAGLRGEQALAKLPEAERQAWQKLWQEVELLRRSAAATTKSADQAKGKEGSPRKN